MKVSNTQAMKMIKEYEEQKRILLRQENNCCIAMYKEGEEKITNDYSYAQTRKQIEQLDDQIRALRTALAKANATVMVEEFDVTIGEALVLLAQLQGQKTQVENLAAKVQRSRRLTPNGIIEFIECVYDVERAKRDANALRKKIGDLQMAIDKANLTNYFEI